MPVNPGVWGIDIGQCALKALRLEQVNGVVTATAFDYVEHPKILSQPDANPDELTREALEKFLSRNPTKGDVVAMSVPGQSGLARFVKLPPVEEKKIVDIVKFEAKQQIPFPLDEVVWDYQKVSEGTVTDGFAMDTEIGLFAMKRDMINRFIGHFQGVKLEVHHVQMSPLALANFITYDLLKRGGIDGEPVQPQTVGKKKCVVALDIGTDASNLIITDGARIIWQRPIPVGGNHFTRALTKELKLTFAKAEHLKRNAAKSPELANILKALRPVLQEFVGEVQRSLGYFTNTHRDAQVEYMVGLGSAFKLPGLQKFLSDKLSLEVRKPDKYQRMAGEAVTDAPVFKENILSFPVAYGLALQGLGVARLSTNLLPPEISFARKIRAKKPYAVAAAAALLLGTTILAYGKSIPLADVSNKKIEDSIAKGKGVVDQAKRVDQDIAAKKAEIEKTQTEVESIIAGQAERKNWIEINQFVNESVPVPGPVGKNAQPIPGVHNMLDERLTLPYWNTVPGRRAIEKLHDRVAKGVDPIQAIADTEGDLREHLAMVDIEAVYCRYAPSLRAVYEEIERKRKREIGGKRLFPGSYLAPTDWWTAKDGQPMPPPENVPEEVKGPEGEGWIFEVRGSTYWHPQTTSQTEQFIMDTLLRNIILNSRPDAEPKTDDAKKTDEFKQALATHPYKGKISHAFLYTLPSGGEDKYPSPGSFRFIGFSLLDTIVPTVAAATEGGGTGGMGGFGSASGPPGGMGMPGPGGLPGPGGVGTGGWAPLGSHANGAGAGGMGMPGPGGMPMFGTGPGPVASSSGGPGPRGGGGPGFPGIPGIPGMAPGMGPGDQVGPGAAVPPKGVKVKPRYEFVIMFAWKEPTPSDKLRPIKKAEAPAGGPGGEYGGGGRGGSGPAPGPSSTPPPSAGSPDSSSGGGRTKIDDLIKD
ncbi:MAG TPA: type IV pilus assembly protein PilM [Gemmataceae bacterium]|nr:type IV pilus assembly protein PilM [Gemmataceae bacterium]